MKVGKDAPAASWLPLARVCYSPREAPLPALNAGLAHPACLAEQTPNTSRPRPRETFPFSQTSLGTPPSKLTCCPPIAFSLSRSPPSSGVISVAWAPVGLRGKDWLMPRMPLGCAGSSRADSLLYVSNSQMHTKWYLQLFPEWWYFSYQCSTFYPISLKYSLEVFLLE